MDAEAFQSALEERGFRFVQQRKDEMNYALRPNRYLTYWVHWDPAQESVLFTWELAVGELMDAAGLQVGSNEALNSFLFPQHDARGPQDPEFVDQELARAEAILRGIDLTGGS